MKKIIIAALSMLTFAACESGTARLYAPTNIPYDSVVYKGHHYLIWNRSRFLNGVVHDPDCPCHKDTSDIWIEKNDTIYRIIKNTHHTMTY